MSRPVMGLAALVIAALAAPASAWALKDETLLVSRQSPAAGGLTGDNFSNVPSISADGNHVAFLSAASNLSSDVNNVGGTEIYVRDLVTGAITLVSRRTGTAPQQSASGVELVSSISGDGRYVAFASANDDLSTEDADGFTDVFVRDLQANTTTLVSCTTCLAADAADAASSQPSIAAGGRRVAFTSDANNLSTEDVNTASNIFVRDLDASTLTLVSRASGASGTAGGLLSDEPAISGDGRHVAFTSFSAGLVPDDVNGATKDVFLRDLQEATTTLVSRPVTGGADCSSTKASVSTDARHIAFISCASNLPGASAGSPGHVFVRDTQTGLTTLVSRQSASDGGLPGDGFSGNPSISGDGRWVAFGSEADNLSAIDNNGIENVFVRDRVGPPPGPPVDPPADPPAGPGPSPGPPATVPAAAPPAAPAPAAPSAVAFGALATLPSNRACVSRRAFRIRLRRPAGTAIASAEVRVNGRRVKSVKGAALSAPVDLRGLPKGRVRVEVRVKLADGRVIRGTRAYRTCAARR